MSMYDPQHEIWCQSITMLFTTIRRRTRSQCEQAHISCVVLSLVVGKLGQHLKDVAQNPVSIHASQARMRNYIWVEWSVIGLPDSNDRSPDSNDRSVIWFSNKSLICVIKFNDRSLDHQIPITYIWICHWIQRQICGAQNWVIYSSALTKSSR